MSPEEIFDLIVKADEALKYAREDKAVARARQAREFLTRAREEAAAMGNDALVAQADLRLADLVELEREIAGGDSQGGGA